MTQIDEDVCTIRGRTGHAAVCHAPSMAKLFADEQNKYTYVVTQIGG